MEPDEIDERLVPQRSRAVHTVELDGEAVLLDETTNELHLLNATGALVWACFDGRSTIAEIVADISEGLGAPYSDVLTDSLAIARDLGQKGLLANVTSRAAAADPPPDADDVAGDDPRSFPNPRTPDSRSSSVPGGRRRPPTASATR